MLINQILTFDKKSPKMLNTLRKKSKAFSRQKVAYIHF